MELVEDKKTKKQIIIEKAAMLFREKGYTGSSMRDIASEVGVEAASLYNHIKSKEEILSEICFTLAEEYTTRMSQVEVSNISAIEKIQTLLALHVELNAMSSPLASVMNDEWRNLSEPQKSDFLKLRKTYEDKFIAILQEGIDQGQIKDVNPNITLYTMLSSIRWLQHWYHANRDMDVEELKQTIINLLLEGINKK